MEKDEKNVSEICRKLFFLTGEIGYYNLANSIEKEDENILNDEEELER